MRCPYHYRCDLYRENAHTCNTITELEYCGKYRELTTVQPETRSKNKINLCSLDHLKLFFRGWIQSPNASNKILYKCPKHGLVECQIKLSMSYGPRFSCPECAKE